MARFRLLVARLWHEGNSFSPCRTASADFHRGEWWHGEDAATFYRDGQSELAAAVAFAASHPDYEVRFSRCAAAAPGGPLVPGVFDRIRDEIAADVRCFQPDAIYLSLHGALLADEIAAPDLSLLKAVREAAGAKVIIGISLDLHANLHPDMPALAQIFSAYATYPHVDMRETGARVLAMIAAALEGAIEPRSALAPLQHLLPSHAMRTAPDEGGPLAEVQQCLRDWEQEHPGVLALSALGGFAFADVPHAGAAGLACVDARQADAESWAARICAELAQRRERFYTLLPTIAQGLESARQLIAEGATRPVAVLDPADNPLSGGLGDTTALLRALLAGPVAGDTVFAFFHDPDLVAEARAAGPGAELDVHLGGRLLPQLGQPVALRLRVGLLSDGKFVNEGPMWAGQARELGPSVVFAHLDQPLRIIVTTTCETPNDPAWFCLHEIDLPTLSLLCIKAKNHFRAAFKTEFAAMIDVDTPGLACLDLTALPFRHVPLARRRHPA